MPRQKSDLLLYGFFGILILIILLPIIVLGIFIISILAICVLVTFLSAVLLISPMISFKVVQDKLSSLKEKVKARYFRNETV